MLETPNAGNNVVPAIPPGPQYEVEEIVEYNFVPLYYGTDDRVLTTINKKELKVKCIGKQKFDQK